MPKLKHFLNNSNGGMVYSTNPDFMTEADESPESDDEGPAKQDFRIHLLRLKGNKVATVLRGYQGHPGGLEEIGKLLKQKCGSGGAVKDWEIILQGDHRQTVATLLEKEGHKYKFAGG